MSETGRNWEDGVMRSLADLHVRIGPKCFNRVPEKMTPFPKALNLCGRNTSELFYYGSFDVVLEYLGMSASSRKKWASVSKRCEKHYKTYQNRRASEKRNYYDRMDENCKREGIDPFRGPSESPRYYRTDRKVRKIAHEMSKIDCQVVEPLQLRDFPRTFPPHVKVISDLRLDDIQMPYDPNVPCLRCRPCKHQDSSAKEVDDILDGILGLSSDTESGNEEEETSSPDPPPKPTLCVIDPITPVNFDPPKPPNPPPKPTRVQKKEILPKRMLLKMPKRKLNRPTIIEVTGASFEQANGEFRLKPDLNIWHFKPDLKKAFVAEILWETKNSCWCLRGRKGARQHRLYECYSDNRRLPPLVGWTCVYKDQPNDSPTLHFRGAQQPMRGDIDMVKQPKKGRIRNCQTHMSDSESSSSDSEALVFPKKSARQAEVLRKLSARQAEVHRKPPVRQAEAPRKPPVRQAEVLRKPPVRQAEVLRKRKPPPTCHAPMTKRRKTETNAVEAADCEAILDDILCESNSPEETRDRRKRSPMANKRPLEKAFEPSEKRFKADTPLSRAKQLKSQADKTVDIHEKINLFIQAGQEFVRSALETKDGNPEFGSLAKYFRQTYELGKGVETLESRTKFLLSICLDCEALLFRELTLQKQAFLQRTGERMQSFLAQYPWKASENSETPARLHTTPGSNPPRSMTPQEFQESLPHFREYLTRCEYAVKIPALLQDARKIRNEHNFVGTDGLLAKDIPSYVSLMIESNERHAMALS